MDIDVYRQKPLRVHSFLAGVPLRTLERVELPGGREGMTIEEISGVVGFGGEVEMEVGPATQALFQLRTFIGRILGWDEAKELVESVSFISRLNEEDRTRSLIVPGKPAGISRILYQFENETLGEIVNRTVHCFWLMATERTANGYALWFAVYVKKLNWFTPIYMALISPLLKWIIYPAMMNGVRRRWEKTFPSGAGVITNEAEPTELLDERLPQHHPQHRAVERGHILEGAGKMKTQSPKIERRIRLAGILLIAGLLVELVTLRWSHPTAFLFFLLLGGALMASGICVYLISLVSAENKPSPE